MNDNMRLIQEVGFNNFYLVFIWIIVIRIYLANGYRKDQDRGTGYLLRLGFLLLPIGDTGHVGFSRAGLLTVFLKN